ncbi:MAG: Carboxylesterase [Candidatus Moranbacteria bacterium GW2011_GWE1_36_7]|nr:MAG: Carboxylesterase [Candidatus Moranbacteria bacterium GW2011_GWD2_36_12]KKQ11413.1 MAG: Carboxylesterase [Candidatus Moranbacteria bacterium GW2011_GWE1_36_7]
MKIAGEALGKAKKIIFADPKLLFEEERHLINQPFFWQGTNDKGILLVHGWTSTPYEVRRLGRYLNENGYTVSGIQLTGHGTVPKDLENVKWQDWIDDIESGYAVLKKSCGKVYIGGTSIGANLAMEFAKKEKNIAGLVIMAAPYKLKYENIVIFFAKVLRIFKKYHRKYYPPTFGVSTTITRLISYQSYPISSSLETFSLIRDSRKRLDLITQPILVMQSTHDHIVQKNSLESIYAGVGSKIKKKIYIKKAYHTFISDIKNEHVFEDIINFLNEN